MACMPVPSDDDTLIATMELAPEPAVEVVPDAVSAPHSVLLYEMPGSVIEAFRPTDPIALLPFAIVGVLAAGAITVLAVSRKGY